MARLPYVYRRRDIGWDVQRRVNRVREMSPGRLIQSPQIQGLPYIDRSQCYGVNVYLCIPNAPARQFASYRTSLYTFTCMYYIAHTHTHTH